LDCENKFERIVPKHITDTRWYINMQCHGFKRDLGYRVNSLTSRQFGLACSRCPISHWYS